MRPCLHTAADECPCPCHDHAGVIHVVPCCRYCRDCGRRIKLPAVPDPKV